MDDVADEEETIMRNGGDRGESDLVLKSFLTLPASVKLPNSRKNFRFFAFKSKETRELQQINKCVVL